MLETRCSKKQKQTEKHAGTKSPFVESSKQPKLNNIYFRYTYVNNKTI